jgi:hypothetical protein
MKALSMCLSILLALGALPAWAGEDICSTAGWQPNYKKEEIDQKCSGAAGDDGACVKTRTKLLEWNDLYKNTAKTACDRSTEALKNIGELSQSGSQDEVISKVQDGESAIDNLLGLNEQLLKKVPGQSKNNTSALLHLSANSAQYQTAVQKVHKDFTHAESSPEILKTAAKPGSRISGFNQADARKVTVQAETLGQSQDFVVSLLKDKEELQNAKTKLEAQKQQAMNAKNNTRTAGDGNNDNSGSGFHPMDLLPLAAPLAGLLMQQKNADSGITDPSTTPDASAPPQVAGTSFGDNNGSSSTPGTSTGGAGTGVQPNSPDHSIGSPVDTSPLASDESMDSGDISRAGDPSGGGSSGGFPFSSGSSLLGSSGSSGSGGQSGEDGRKPAAAKADAVAGDEGMMGGGGGGLTFNGAGGETSAGSDGMQDVLQDMEATLDDSPTGIFAEAEQKANEAEIESPDSLFPRVRACYVRNLKKGNVLNGLGEKLPEGESD